MTGYTLSEKKQEAKKLSKGSGHTVYVFKRTTAGETYYAVQDRKGWGKPVAAFRDGREVTD